MIPLGAGRVWGIDDLTRDTHHLRISPADDATKATIVEQRDYSRAAYGITIKISTGTTKAKVSCVATMLAQYFSRVRPARERDV